MPRFLVFSQLLVVLTHLILRARPSVRLLAGTLPVLVLQVPVRIHDRFEVFVLFVLLEPNLRSWVKVWRRQDTIAWQLVEHVR